MQSPDSNKNPTIPISFIIVKLSEKNNYLLSKCIVNPFNQLIEVDNRKNLFFNNHSEAISSGIVRTQHDLIAIVDEDVILPDDWQFRFEMSLKALEKEDHNWGVIGAYGWDESKKQIGRRYDSDENAELKLQREFISVSQLDEKIMILNKNRFKQFDTDLPSFHHIADDIGLSVKKKGLKAYVIDAPIIYKNRSKRKNREIISEDLTKVSNWGLVHYKIERDCSSEYMKRKWPQIKIDDFTKPELKIPKINRKLKNKLDEPIILLVRGGGGSRLLSNLCLDLGIFLGNDLNVSNDSLEMVLPVYKAVFKKYRCKAGWQKEQIVPSLRAAAAKMLQRRNKPFEQWGFKLPESMLILPELRLAFPKARFLYMIRDPLATCLRRTHMTARINNIIGKISLSLAYDYHERPRKMILEDSPAMHMAYTTIHQLEITANQFSEIGPEQWMKVNFEDLIKNPTESVEQVSNWLGLPREKYKLEDLIDPERAQKTKTIYSPEIEEQVKNVLHPIRVANGYITD
jgi:hypothetical protein